MAVLCTLLYVIGVKFVPDCLLYYISIITFKLGRALEF